MDTLTRRTFLSGLALPMLSVAQTKRPNIVFIILDDLGFGDFGCYGQKLIQTPNVDRFSKQGMRFTDAYAGCTVCAPSRCALMTGLHNGHGAIRANAGTAPISAADVTLSNEMHKAGYKVGGFGKWGLGDKDTSGDPMKHGDRKSVV